MPIYRAHPGVHRTGNLMQDSLSLALNTCITKSEAIFNLRAYI